MTDVTSTNNSDGTPNPEAVELKASAERLFEDAKNVADRIEKAVKTFSDEESPDNAAIGLADVEDSINSLHTALRTEKAGSLVVEGQVENVLGEL